jgi:hypothetical protein
VCSSTGAERAATWQGTNQVKTRAEASLLTASLWRNGKNEEEKKL